MKKITLLIFLAVFQQYTVIAQDWYQNLEKYWWYRYRLVNDFMKVGDKPGESIPAMERMRTFKTGDPFVTQSQLQFSDQTELLGQYIAMLSAEYRMLKNNSWQTSRTLYELQMAIGAFDRLDRTAEEKCRNVDITTNGQNINPQPGDFNGFFIRDDVPFDEASSYLVWSPGQTKPDYGVFGPNDNFVINNYKHFNRPGIINVLPVDKLYDCASCGKTANTVSGFPNYVGGPQRFPSEESQDQMAEMVTGMGLATRLVDNTAIQDKSADALYRMISWIPKIRNWNWADEQAVNNIMPAPYPWLIKNPVNNRCVYSGGGAQQFNTNTGCSGTGAMFTVNGPPASKAVEFVCQNYNSSAYNSSWLQATAAPYDPFFQLMQLVDGNLQEDIQFTDALVSFARNWWLSPPIPPRPPVWIGAWPPFSINLYNTSWLSIKYHAISAEFHTPHIPLVYQLNHGKTNFEPEHCVDIHGDPAHTPMPPSYVDLFNSAGPCGIYSYDRTHGHFSHNEWSGINRLSHAITRWGFPRGDNHEHNSDFSGLDYMDMFALYNLVEGNYLHCLINPYYAENYSINYPDGQGYGSHGNALSLNFLEYLSWNSKVNANGEVWVRGAKVIDLLPGHQTDFGATVDFNVLDYTCRNMTEDRYHFAYLKEEGPNSNWQPLQYCPTNKAYIPHDIGEADWDDTHTPPDWVIELLANPLKNGFDTTQWNKAYEHADDDMRKQMDEIMQNVHASVSKGKQMAPLAISVYPNPTDGLFFVSIKEKGGYEVVVANALGQTILTQKIMDGVTPINLSSFVAGNYTVTISSEKIREIKKITLIK